MATLLAFGRSRLLYDAIAGLARRGHRFSAVVTDAPYPEYDVTEREFEVVAKKLGVPFFLTSDLNSVPEAIFLESDYAISANWRRIIPAQILRSVRKGMLNYHLGNLPDYRGNATAQWAIINGESTLYANVHKMVAELDAGDVLSRHAIPLGEQTYISHILAQAAVAGPDLFAQAIAAWESDPAFCLVPGSAVGLRCYPRLPEDSRIDWAAPAAEVQRLVRASSRPYTGAFSSLDGKRFTIWKAHTVTPPFPFLAMPGQVVEINREDGTASIACAGGFLEVEEASLEGTCDRPAAFFHSIRQRLRSSNS